MRVERYTPFGWGFCVVVEYNGRIVDVFIQYLDGEYVPREDAFELSFN